MTPPALTVISPALEPPNVATSRTQNVSMLLDLVISPHPELLLNQPLSATSSLLTTISIPANKTDNITNQQVPKAPRLAPYQEFLAKHLEVESLQKENNKQELLFQRQ